MWILMHGGNPDGGITIYSDSKLAIGCATRKWRPRRNVLLVNNLQSIATTAILQTNVVYHWVKAHSCNRYNQFADEAAKLVASGVEILF